MLKANALRAALVNLVEKVVYLTEEALIRKEIESFLLLTPFADLDAIFFE